MRSSSRLTTLSPARLETAIVSRIEARRMAQGLDGLLPPDHALLHAPNLADAWHIFFAELSPAKLSISIVLQKIAICRVNLLNEAWYALEAHSQFLRTHDTFSTEKLNAVMQRDISRQGPLDNDEWAVVKFADAVTRRHGEDAGPEPVSQMQAAGLSDKSVVELTILVAAYNMVSRL